MFFENSKISSFKGEYHILTKIIFTYVVVVHELCFDCSLIRILLFGWMELALPTHVSHPPSLEMCTRTMQGTHPSNKLSTQFKNHYWLNSKGGYATRAHLKGRRAGIPVLAGLAPYSPTLGSLLRDSWAALKIQNLLWPTFSAKQICTCAKGLALWNFCSGSKC